MPGRASLSSARGTVAARPRDGSCALAAYASRSTRDRLVRGCRGVWCGGSVAGMLRGWSARCPCVGSDPSRSARGRSAAGGDRAADMARRLDPRPAYAGRWRWSRWPGGWRFVVAGRSPRCSSSWR